MGCDQEIAAFAFEESSVRVLPDVDGETWFVAADVLGALALDRKALERLDPDEKGVNSIHTLGGQQELTTISEPGLYNLILRSRKPSAKRFRRWVTHEVLPAIRRHGRYTAPRSLPEALRLAASLAEKTEAQAATIEAQQPDVEFVDRFVRARDSYSIREAAKIVDIPEREFIGQLLADGILYRMQGDDRLVPKAEYQKRGLFSVKAGEKHGKAYAQTRVMAGGIEWLAKRYGTPKVVIDG